MYPKTSFHIFCVTVILFLFISVDSRGGNDHAKIGDYDIELPSSIETVNNLKIIVDQYIIIKKAIDTEITLVNAKTGIYDRKLQNRDLKIAIKDNGAIEAKVYQYKDNTKTAIDRKMSFILSKTGKYITFAELSLDNYILISNDKLRCYKTRLKPDDRNYQIAWDLSGKIIKEGFVQEDKAPESKVSGSLKESNIINILKLRNISKPIMSKNSEMSSWTLSTLNGMSAAIDEVISKYSDVKLTVKGGTGIYIDRNRKTVLKSLVGSLESSKFVLNSFSVIKYYDEANGTPNLSKGYTFVFDESGNVILFQSLDQKHTIRFTPDQKIKMYVFRIAKGINYELRWNRDGRIIFEGKRKY